MSEFGYKQNIIFLLHDALKAQSDERCANGNNVTKKRIADDSYWLREHFDLAAIADFLIEKLEESKMHPNERYLIKVNPIEVFEKTCGIKLRINEEQKMDSNIKIDSKIWVYNENRRVYPKDGRPCTYRGHWEEFKIKGETARSWLYGYGIRLSKINKKNPSWFVCFDEKELDEKCWIHDNCRKIRDLINSNVSYKKLKNIAELLDYEPATNPTSKAE